MKLTTKIKLGALGIIGGVAITATLKKTIDGLVNTHLSSKGIQHIKADVMSQKNKDDFANSPEVILGTLFHNTTPQTNITIPNREGRYINALVYNQNEESSKYVILVHGYRSQPKSLSYLAKHYFEAGYNVILPYMRAHYGSDYEYSTMGWFERFDIMDWIDYIDSKVESAHVILHGVSMGAATVMMTTGEHLPSCVKCAIEDCGYTSVYDAYSYKIPKMMHIPAFPTVDIFGSAIKKKIGFDIKVASALDQVKKSQVPTLFIHGESDSVVPVSMVYKLYENAACEKDILIVKNADHAMSPLVSPELYWNRVWNFIDMYK